MIKLVDANKQMRQNLANYSAVKVSAYLLLTAKGLEEFKVLADVKLILNSQSQPTPIDLIFTLQQDSSVAATSSDIAWDISTAQAWTLTRDPQTDTFFTTDNISNLVLRIDYTAKI